jgi:hypothetical protein
MGNQSSCCGNSSDDKKTDLEHNNGTQHLNSNRPKNQPAPVEVINSQANKGNQG